MAKRSPIKRLKNNVMWNVFSVLKRRTGARFFGAWSRLPYTPVQLKEHLEKQFQEGMTWDNWGNGSGCWSIDHIYPKSKLPYDITDHPNFQMCWALINLQPMWHEDNVAKGASIPDE